MKAVTKLILVYILHTFPRKTKTTGLSLVNNSPLSYTIELRQISLDSLSLEVQ